MPSTVLQPGWGCLPSLTGCMLLLPCPSQPQKLVVSAAMNENPAIGPRTISVPRRRVLTGCLIGYFCRVVTCLRHCTVRGDHGHPSSCPACPATPPRPCRCCGLMQGGHAPADHPAHSSPPCQETKKPLLLLSLASAGCRVGGLLMQVAHLPIPHSKQLPCMRSFPAGCRVGGLLMQAVPRYLPTELHSIADQEVGAGWAVCIFALLGFCLHGLAAHRAAQHCRPGGGCS